MKEKIITKEKIPYYIIAAVLICSVFFVFSRRTVKNNYATKINHSYQVSMSKAAGYAEEMDRTFELLKITGAHQRSIPYLASLWRLSGQTHDIITAMPYDHEMVGDTLHFLSQTEQLSYDLMVKVAEGSGINQEDWEKIDKLSGYGKKLSDELGMTLSSIHLGGGVVGWEDLLYETPYTFDREDGYKVEALLGSMLNVNRQFNNFDETTKAGSNQINPYLLKDRGEITVNEGAEIVRDFLKGYAIDQIIHTGSTDLTIENITPVNSYDVVLAGSTKAAISVDITQEGGFPLWMLNYGDQDTGANYITMEKAIKLSDKFLLDNGYGQMEAQFYETMDGIATVFYYPVISGVILYPDEIKVKVNMSSGMICGFESSKYLQNYKDRGTLEAPLSVGEIQEYMDEFTSLEHIKIALICPSTTEVLVYQAKGRVDNQNYLIYYNASSGKQEKIVKLIESENKYVYVSSKSGF